MNGSGYGDVDQGQRELLARFHEFRGERRCMHFLADRQGAGAAVHQGLCERHLALASAGIDRPLVIMSSPPVTHSHSLGRSEV